MKEPYIVVNFSGGKDSTAMVLRMIELGEHIDEVVCCDTTKEFPAMYRHIDMVRIAVEDAGIKFTLIRAEYDFDHYMFDKKIKRRKPNSKPPFGNAWPLPTTRWCTTLLKKQPIDSYLKQLRQTHNVIQCIGIAADEAYRLERANNQNPNHRHPLVEWGWTEADCLKYCYDHGYDWNGLYEIFSRVSCWCCPLKPLDELRKLRKYFPDLWEELKNMDSRSWNQFKENYSVDDIEIRFRLEEERTARGLSITNRDFHSKLKELLEHNREAHDGEDE